MFGFFQTADLYQAFVSWGGGGRGGLEKSQVLNQTIYIKSVANGSALAFGRVADAMEVDCWPLWLTLSFVPDRVTGCHLEKVQGEK